MTLREQYWEEKNIAKTEAIKKPLVEMRGYIEWLEEKVRGNVSRKTGQSHGKDTNDH